jgi:hypothetical protein
MRTIRIESCKQTPSTQHSCTKMAGCIKGAPYARDKLLNLVKHINFNVAWWYMLLSPYILIYYPFIMSLSPPRFRILFLGSMSAVSLTSLYVTKYGGRSFPTLVFQSCRLFGQIDPRVSTLCLIKHPGIKCVCVCVCVLVCMCVFACTYVDICIACVNIWLRVRTCLYNTTVFRHC